MLTVEGLRSRYGRIEVLHGIDLAVNSGEIVTVVGANGAGKTTLLRCLSGVQPVTGGSITFRGESFTAVPGLQARRLRPRPVARGPAILHQPDRRGESAPQRLPLHRRAGGEGHGQRLRHVPDPEGEAQPRRRRPLRRPQQMLAIARALMGRPSCLLLDEPSMGLAPILVARSSTW